MNSFETFLIQYLYLILKQNCDRLFRDFLKKTWKVPKQLTVEWSQILWSFFECRLHLTEFVFFMRGTLALSDGIESF